MSQEAVERLLGRLITDERFREMAEASLPQACRQYGFQLSPAEMCLVSLLDMGWFTEFSQKIDHGLCRANATCRT